GDIGPYSVDLDAIHHLARAQSISVTVEDFTCWEIRSTGNHGHLVAVFYPLPTVFVGPGCGGVDFRRKIVREKKNVHVGAKLVECEDRFQKREHLLLVWRQISQTQGTIECYRCTRQYSTGKGLNARGLSGA